MNERYVHIQFHPSFHMPYPCDIPTSVNENHVNLTQVFKLYTIFTNEIILTYNKDLRNKRCR